MPSRLEASDGQSVIHLEGAIDIGSAQALKQMLLEALGAGKPLCVNLSEAEDLDLSCLQLLWACASSARSAGVGFRVSGEPNERIAANLADTGLLALLDPILETQPDAQPDVRADAQTDAPATAGLATAEPSLERDQLEVSEV